MQQSGRGHGTACPDPGTTRAPDASSGVDSMSDPRSAFYWQGPSQTIDKHGRIKTQRQMLLDALRENPEVHLRKSNEKTNSERAPR